MRIPITATYTLGTLAVAATVLAFSLWATRYYFERDFTHYVFENEQHQLSIVAAELEALYAQSGSWSFLDDNPGLWRGLSGPQRGRRRPGNRRSELPAMDSKQAPENDRHTNREYPRRHDADNDQASFQSDAARPHPADRPPPPRHRNTRRLILVDADRKLIKGPHQQNNAPPITASARIEQPVYFDGKPVGYLQNRSVERVSQDIDLAFSNSQRTVILWVGSLSMILASIFAFLMARRLVSPIKKINQHTRNLQQGNYTPARPLTRDDELGDLAKGLDDLAETLAQNKTARQRWFADISHELRTPLAVVKGEIEALQDGVRPLSTAALTSLAVEVEHLNYLINDLNQLTLSDMGALNYEKSPLNLKILIDEITQGQQGHLLNDQVSLRSDKIASDAWIMGDPHRIKQLFSNLLDNAIKYSDKPAQIELICTVEKDQVQFTIQDSPPGIADDLLDKIFDPLYRTDPSRTGRSSGLGLAICRNLAAGHQASITAHHSDLGGLGITIVFPRLREH